MLQKEGRRARFHDSSVFESLVEFMSQMKKKNLDSAWVILQRVE